MADGFQTLDEGKLDDGGDMLVACAGFGAPLDDAVLGGALPWATALQKAKKGTQIANVTHFVAVKGPSKAGGDAGSIDFAKIATLVADWATASQKKRQLFVLAHSSGGSVAHGILHQLEQTLRARSKKPVDLTGADRTFDVKIFCLDSGVPSSPWLTRIGASVTGVWASGLLEGHKGKVQSTHAASMRALKSSFETQESNVLWLGAPWSVPMMRKVPLAFAMTIVGFPVSMAKAQREFLKDYWVGQRVIRIVSSGTEQAILESRVKWYLHYYTVNRRAERAVDAYKFPLPDSVNVEFLSVTTP